MKKFFFFFLFSISLCAQKTEIIELTQNIKDKKGLIKSLTLVDNRADKEIGSVSNKGESIGVKFANSDLTTFVQNWFSEDNKGIGNTDIVLMLEELKVYDEQSQNDMLMFGKAKIKISSFIKRNDKYYFINRFDNVIVSDPRRTPNVGRYLSQNISNIITEFIKASYTNSVLSQYIPENEINNYSSYLNKNIKSLNTPELREGVYLNFKSFSTQEPAFGHYIEKNKKGKVVKIKNREVSISLNETFCYVEAGKAYRFTPVGFLEMTKDDKGFYIISARTELFAETKSGGIVIGAIAGGLVGAAIGAAINKGTMNGIGFKSASITHVYIDSLTGDYIFES